MIKNILDMDITQYIQMFRYIIEVYNTKRKLPLAISRF